jgi:hypothetical protein
MLAARFDTSPLVVSVVVLASPEMDGEAVMRGIV